MQLSIVYRLATAEDEAAWSDFVEQHPEASLGHQFAWFHQIQTAMSLPAYFWMAWQDQKVVALAPFVMRSHVGLGRRLTSLPYVNSGGLLALDKQIENDFGHHILTWARGKRVDSIELRNRYHPLQDYAIREGRSVFVIPLDCDEEIAWKRLKSNARNHVRVAQRKGLDVRHGLQYLHDFWQVYAQNMHLLGAPTLPENWFNVLHKNFATHLITIWDDQTIVGGMVLVSYGKGAEDIWAATTQAGRKMHATDFLYWEAIRWALTEGCEWLDLGRSQTGSGHEAFKKKFYAQASPLPYQELHRKENHWLAQTDEPQQLYDLFTSVWSRLPQSLANRIGPYFSRQLY